MASKAQKTKVHIMNRQMSNVNLRLIWLIWEGKQMQSNSSSETEEMNSKNAFVTHQSDISCTNRTKEACKTFLYQFCVWSKKKDHLLETYGVNPPTTELCMLYSYI